MVQFRSVGKIDNPLVDITCPYNKPQYVGISNQLTELQSKSDVILATYNDGTRILVSRVNMNGGQCDCCRDEKYDSENIASWEGFILCNT